MSKDHLEAKMLLAGYVLDWGRAPHELYVVCKEGGYRVSASELGIRRSEIEARIAKNSGFDLGSARRQPSPVRLSSWEAEGLGERVRRSYPKYTQGE